MISEKEIAVLKKGFNQLSLGQMQNGLTAYYVRPESFLWNGSIVEGNKC